MGAPQMWHEGDDRRMTERNRLARAELRSTACLHEASALLQIADEMHEGGVGSRVLATLANGDGVIKALAELAWIGQREVDGLRAPSANGVTAFDKVSDQHSIALP